MPFVHIKSLPLREPADIAERLTFPIDNTFINHRQAQSGTVFAYGKIVEW